MADQQEPAKKVAKRVVKKTVVKRPVSTPAAPTVRYGRPTQTPAPKAPAKPAKGKSRPGAKSPKQSTRKQPAQFGKKAGKAVGASTGKAAGAVAGGVKSTAGKVGSFGGSTMRSVRAFRIPRLESTRAAAIVGILVGLIAVGVTALFTMLFSEIRGTSTGGGGWGSLTFVVVTFIAFALGEFLLTKMHVRQPRITSFLAICLTLFLILAAFLNFVGGVWALLIVPVLGAITYAIAHRVIRWADSNPRQG